MKKPSEAPWTRPSLQGTNSSRSPHPRGAAEGSIGPAGQRTPDDVCLLRLGSARAAPLVTAWREDEDTCRWDAARGADRVRRYLIYPT